MSKLFENLKLLASLLPIILSAVRAIEEALPESGQGAEKLKAIRELIESAWATVQGVSVSFTDAWPLIEKAVAAVVGLFNRTGAFKKG